MQKNALNCFLNVDFNEVLRIHPNGFLTCPRTESLLVWKLISVMIPIQVLTASTSIFKTNDAEHGISAFIQEF